jgi:hypothetical protein
VAYAGPNTIKRYSRTRNLKGDIKGGYYSSKDGNEILKTKYSQLG